MMHPFLRPFTLLLSIATAWAAPAGPGRPFPAASWQALGRPWLESTSDEPLFAPAFQARKAAAFRQAYLGPWDPGFAAGRFTPRIQALEATVLANLEQDIAAGAGFGPGLQPYGPEWLGRIKAQLPPAREGGFRFQPGNRAMITGNALVRLLPTMDLFMRDPDIPGEGYAFDNLQYSVLWAGTPVYLLEQTRDQAWCKVLASDCAGWIPSPSVARAGGAFVRRWRGAVLRHGLAAAIVTGTPVVDGAGRFRFHAYVGSVFPRRPGRGILIPCRSAAQRALCRPGFLAPGAGVAQPWAYTPRHAAVLWKTLLDRPYGWGNAGFRNDCSAELKHFFAPFGLWLPRGSTEQRDAGRSADLSALGLPERLAALPATGRPYRSLVWIEGHVMLYLGPLAGTSGFMAYQNLWGLRPRELPDFRAVIGRSALFPVLASYPGAPELRSLADHSRFVVTALDEDPEDH